MPKSQNIKLDRGDDVRFLVEFVTDDFAETPIALSEFVSIRFRLLDNWGLPEIFVAQLGDNLTPFDEFAALLEIPREVTAQLSADRVYRYDVEVVTADDRVTTTQRGYLSAGPN